MKCPSCGQENIRGSDTCSHCGASLYGVETPSQFPDFIHDSLATISLRPAIQLGPADPVSLAIREMKRADTNAVLIVDNKKLTGIITGWDIVQKLAGATEDHNAVTCGEIMTPDPLVLHREDTVAMALNLMAARGMRHVPIVNGDGPEGVIVAADLFRHVSPQLV
jgi:signal-transduction protein with cAMP-binding, CBS, and nucleotidyltransferase domain